MQLAVLVCLLYFKWIPLGLLLFICCKEVILCIGALYLLKKGVHVQSDKSGKFATFVFYLCTFIFVLCDPNVTIKFVLYVLMIITALYALIDYSSIFVDNTNIFKRNEKND